MDFFYGFGGLILVDSTTNWFYDFASLAGEMALPKNSSRFAVEFRFQRMAVTSTDTKESVSSTPRTSHNATQSREGPIQRYYVVGRSRLKSLCLDERMPARL
jgi:hypothetical protein